VHLDLHEEKHKTILLSSNISTVCCIPINMSLFFIFYILLVVIDCFCCCSSLGKTTEKCCYQNYTAVEKTRVSLIRTSTSFETIDVPSLDTLSFCFSFTAIHSLIFFVYNFVDFSRSLSLSLSCLRARCPYSR
jgi:hypothetical protein